MQSLVFILTFFVSISLVRPETFASESIDKAFGTAKQDLESSLAELSKLRESIGNEKIPLSLEIDQLEEKLSNLRKDSDKVARTLDSKSLDLNNLKTLMKSRQDEMQYLNNLLDEFTRGFETKLSLGESDRYSQQIEASKAAPQNPDLAPTKKFAAQIAVLKTSANRVQELIGGALFPGSAVTPTGQVAYGKFAMVGPITLFASDQEPSAGIVIAQSGSTRPSIRPLDDHLNPGLASVVRNGEGILPLDPSRGGAIKELIQRWSLIGIFKKGGPIMWPLLLASIIAWAAVIERFVFIIVEQKRRNPKVIREMLDSIEVGDIESAIRIGQASKYFVAKVLTYALVHREKSISNALMLASALEIKRFSRGLPILDTTITVAPLLGLLGTVTGMMHSFSLIGGDLGAPGAITGGIAEALIATAFGLGIAITGLLPFNYLNARLEEATHEIEAAATRLELLVHPPQHEIAPKSVHVKSPLVEVLQSS
jgi:biopolymer transport protein ExbB